MSRKDSLEQIQNIKNLFTPYIGKQLFITFGKFCFPIVVKDIRLARLNDLVNKPEKRIDSDGKKYSPAILQILTESNEEIDDTLEFWLEDMKVKVIAHGIVFIVGEMRVEFKDVE